MCSKWLTCAQHLDGIETQHHHQLSHNTAVPGCHKKLKRNSFSMTRTHYRPWSGVLSINPIKNTATKPRSQSRVKQGVTKFSRGHEPSMYKEHMENMFYLKTWVQQSLAWLPISNPVPSTTSRLRACAAWRRGSLGLGLRTAILALRSRTGLDWKSSITHDACANCSNTVPQRMCKPDRRKHIVFSRMETFTFRPVGDLHNLPWRPTS